MKWLSDQACRLYDTLEATYESALGRRVVANILIFTFVVGMLLIEANRQGFLPPSLSAELPTNHFFAVDFTFRLLLVFELGELIFGLAYSVANSVGKQIEILSLILLRTTFKEFTHFDEPILWEQVQPALLPISADAVGALLVFVILGFYYQAQIHRPITDDAQRLAGFIAAKKMIALVLLFSFIGIGIYAVEEYLVAGRSIAFFDAAYTVLIFADVLLVLVSLRYSSTYVIVFRNSGFAIATVLIRLALLAPPPFNAVLGVGSALFALGLTLAYNHYVRSGSASEHHAPVPQPG